MIKCLLAVGICHHISVEYPAECSVNSPILRGFKMVAYEKICFEACTSNQHTFDTKNNIAQIYFILGAAELHWNFLSILMDAPDIHRFSNRNWVLSRYTIGNL